MWFLMRANPLLGELEGGWALVMDLARLKPLRTAPYKQQVPFINSYFCHFLFLKQSLNIICSSAPNYLERSKRRSV
jgi:hypothetical protein